jgi:phage-related protein
MAEDFTNINPDAQAQENRIVNKALSQLPAPIVSGMTLGADISIGSLTLNTIDSNGVVWVCTDIEGWWTTPDPELPDLPRGWGDGSYDSRGRYTARNLTLAGAFLTQDPSQVAAARKTLIEAIDLVYDGADLVVNESPVKISFVRLSGRPQIATVNARGRTEFSVGLKAPDPIKYEYLTTGTNIEDGYRTKSIATATATTFNNTGNTKTPVIIELTGPIPSGSTIANAINYSDANKDDVTEAITLVKAVPSGSKLEIDTLNREAILVTGSAIENGRSYISTLSSWFYIQPDSKAENKITFTSATGSCKVFHRSGWIG